MVISAQVFIVEADVMNLLTPVFDFCIVRVWDLDDVKQLIPGLCYACLK